MPPKRDKQAKQKPRKDWLVAVGRGLSPSSTMSGQDIAARKKVDAENLSFSGLEQEGRKSQPPSFPTSPPSRLQKSSTSLFTTSPPPSHSTSPTSSKVGSPVVISASRFPSPIRDGKAVDEGESTPDGCGCEVPHTSETTAGIAGSTEQGGSPFRPTGLRDAPPRPLTFVSPGKEYWTGRIAGSPRNSDSLRAHDPQNKKKMHTRGIGSTGSTGRGAFVFKNENKLRLDTTIASDPQALLSGKQTSGYSHSSSWSTQASIFSSSPGSTLSPSPGVLRRSGTSPVVETSRQRSSWTPGVAISGDVMSPMTRFQHLNVHSTIRTRTTSLSTNSVSSLRRESRSLSPVPQASGRTSGLAKRGKTSNLMGRFNLSTDSKVREGATSLSPTFSSRIRCTPRSFSPAENHSDASFGKGSLSASLEQQQASPTNLECVTTPPSPAVSPFRFSSITAEVGHDEKICPERTTPPRDCPEITAPLPTGDDVIDSSTCLIHRKGAPEASAAYGVEPSGNGSIGDGTEECIGYDGEIVMEDYGDPPARPLHSPPVSPASREPTPCKSLAEHHHVFIDDMEQASPSLGRSWSKASAAASERRSSSRDDEEVPIRVHLPRGVCAKILHVSSPSSSGASASGSSDSRDEVGAEPKVLVSTPTGDGGPADLSLWVTLRGDTTTSISSPFRTAPADEKSALRAPYDESVGPTPEGDGPVATEEAMTNDLFEDQSAGRREVIQCGLGGRWCSFVETLLGLPDFCCPQET